MEYRKIILSKLIVYLKTKKIKLSRGNVKTLPCPQCGKTANIIPNVNEINCFVCKPKALLNRYWNLIDIVKIIEKDKEKWDEEKILQYLKEYLDIKVTTSKDNEVIENILIKYQEWGFDLLPVTANSKVPFEKKDWNLTSHKEIQEWKNWLKEGLNIGVKTGKISGITVIDIDALTRDEKKEIRERKISKERYKELMQIRQGRLDKVYKEMGDRIGKPLIQTNLGGHHLIYKYEEDIPKTYINVKDIHLDIENKGGYILVAPSKVGNNDSRSFIENIIPSKMSDELKQFILSKSKPTNKTYSEGIIEDIKTEDFKIDPKKFLLKNNQLEGCCNTEFIKLGGILRKKLNLEETKYVLYTLNKHILERPMQPRVISSMVRELDKYVDFDEKQLANKVLEYLKDVEEAGRIEIAMAVVGTNRGEEKKRIDKTLQYLIKEKRVIKNGKAYEISDSLEWQEKFMETGTPIDFKMPYFYDTMYFHKGDLLLIGASPAIGKTHIAVNIMKRLIEQNIKPCYISLEGGSRWAGIAKQLGLKEGDFEFKETSNPNKIRLKDDAVTIIDWICPRNYAETDKVLQSLNDKVRETKGVLIIFAQLRTNNSWLAPDLIKQFPSFACKYIYDKEDDGTYGRFHIDKLRDAKVKIKNYKIPCKYEWDSKELIRIDELDEDIKETG